MFHWLMIFEQGSECVQLFLAEVWDNDKERWKIVEVSESLRKCTTKLQLALDRALVTI